MNERGERKKHNNIQHIIPIHVLAQSLPNKKIRSNAVSDPQIEFLAVVSISILTQINVKLRNVRCAMRCDRCPAVLVCQKTPPPASSQCAFVLATANCTGPVWSAAVQHNIITPSLDRTRVQQTHKCKANRERRNRQTGGTNSTHKSHGIELSSLRHSRNVLRLDWLALTQLADALQPTSTTAATATVDWTYVALRGYFYFGI